MNAGVIINPIAGSRARLGVGRRIQLAQDMLQRCGIEGQVTVTEGPGHGREVAGAMVERGADTVVVWGGDGTVNEVASQVASSRTSLGIVPGGSGNGLARELHLDWEPERALETALRGDVRRIDAGEIGGRLFFNVAGVGFDAHLAAMFNARPRRGALGYFALAVRELATYEPACYWLRTSQLVVTEKALIVAVANTCQYGNRAIIAPQARPDDGLLELVVLPTLSPAMALWHARRLFLGTVHRLRGVRMHSVREAEIAGEGSLLFHVDGEPVTGPSSLSVKVYPRALRVRVPHNR